MTPNPECATVDTPIVDALHTMHDGKFLHLPVLNGGCYSIFYLVASSPRFFLVLVKMKSDV